MANENNNDNHGQVYADGKICAHFVNAYVGRVNELRQTPNGVSVLDVSVGVNTYAGPGKEPNKQWFSTTFWGSLAERAAKALRPGSRMFLAVDQINLDTYTDKEGKSQSRIKLRANDFQLTGSAPRRNEEDAQPEAPVAPVEAPAQSDVDTDDIPF